MTTQTLPSARLPSQAAVMTPAHCANVDRKQSHPVGLDPRRARMVREVDDFGFEWRVLLEGGRLVAAMAVGAILTFGLIGHPTSTATTRPPVPFAGIAPPAIAPAASPEEQGLPQLLAPLVAPSKASIDTLQRDVHSDGGGH